MSESIPQKVKGEQDQRLDVERLIKSVRGSQMVRVLHEYRSVVNSSGALHVNQPDQQASSLNPTTPIKPPSDRP